ncbi:General amino acid permease [Wickerhamomyces ciferrii]|uniref:General amino acid permease n=1 Tax=Wickerhamomyces ciferrii (strain ATCC 14091 / BCRC 22168 / CBS 111 / JCM 3599 / NBRC 0793 / NRRL Y-1031 F-60-10) TaxID=1206466 RepID=K0KA62_WICCF|nr:General amino acid permease [Wickerhamomyces ciferrii]CCH41815.1 General amino acid permease [Wickerhamomyces ciferrii]
MGLFANSKDDRKPESIDLEKKIDSSSSSLPGIGSSSSDTAHGESASVEEFETGGGENGSVKRTLAPSTIYFIAVGSSIGTALFVTIGKGLAFGGPLSLLMAFCLWTGVIAIVVGAVGEMVCFLPVAAPFQQMAGRCVDEAFELTVAFNYYIFTSIAIPFEITAVNGMIHFWADNYSPGITFAAQIALYVGLNVFAVKYFGQSELHLCATKLLLAVGLIAFTFVTMVGGNPQHEAYGFRYWNNPGPLAERFVGGSMGKFHGFMGAMNSACFTIVGPDYVAMVASEAGGQTRKVLSKTFKIVAWRMTVFFIFGALCVGILLPYNDPKLDAMANGSGGESASYAPYVIAMTNMKIKVLPHIINVGCLFSALSAGNAYFYCSTRALYGAAKRGFAPKFLTYCTKSGIPIYTVGAAFCWGSLALLQLGSGSSQVLTWIVNILSGAQIINYLFMLITYLGFHYACKAQGIAKSVFHYKAFLQPYLSYFSAFIISCMVGALGYSVFMPGKWSVSDFLTYYLMPLLDLVIFVIYKLVKRTKMVHPSAADIYTGIEEVELHEQQYLESLESKDENSASENSLVDKLVHRFL